MEKNPTTHPFIDFNKLVKMRLTLIKNKYLSEMEIDKQNVP